MAQSDKKLCPLCYISQEPYIYDCHLWNTCKIISPVFFYFFKIFIFQVVMGIKGQKIVQNDKNFCSLLSISQKPYIIMITIYETFVKWWYLQGSFSFFSGVIFWLPGGWKGKNDMQWQKILSVAPCISGTIHHIIFICDKHL